MTDRQVLSLTDNTDMHDPPYEIVVDMKLPGIMRYLRAFHMAPLLKSLILQDFDLYYLKPNDVVSTTVEELSVLRKRAEFKRTDGQPRNLGEVQRINRRLALFNIEALSLDSNQFNDLPEHVFVLTRLSMLSLAHNQLEILGKKVEVWSSLTVLHLNNNRLGSIPDELASSCRMKKLTLDHNEFIFFPDVILQLTALEVLNLASNQIEELPAEMPSSNSNLKMLALQHNGLHSLPADIGMLQKLVLCDLSHNHLIALPQSISQVLIALPSSIS
jgi:Leucine-rich repeat (LRR) protein